MKIAKTAELTYSRVCLQGDQALSASCCCTTGSQSIPYPHGEGDDRLKMHALPSVGCSSPPSSSTVVRRRHVALVALSHHACWARTCCVSAKASCKRFKSSRAVSRCWLETRLTSALSVRPWYARMMTSCWAPVAKQYYSLHNGNQRSAHDGTENEGRKSKRLCSVKAEAPDIHSCGGLPPWLVWQMSDERRHTADLRSDYCCYHCPWWRNILIQPESLKFFDLGFLPAISKILELIVMVCVPPFPVNFRHARHGACSSCSAFF